MRIDVGCGFRREGDLNLDANREVKPDIVCDMQYLPLRDEIADFMLYKHTLEHIGNPIKALKEAHRVLKKGGAIDVFVPNQLAWQRKGCACEFDTHKTAFNPFRLKYAFHKAGFKPMDLHGHGFVWNIKIFPWKFRKLILYLYLLMCSELRGVSNK